MKRDLFVSKVTANDETVKLISWLVADREFVNIGQPVLLIETSKVNVEVLSEFSGYIHQYCKENDIIDIGAAVASVYENLEEIKQYDPDKIFDANIGIASNFSKSAKRYIEEHGLDPNDFLGIGLVTEEKIKAQISNNHTTQANLNFDKTVFPDGFVEPVSYAKLTEISMLNRTKSSLIPSSLTIQFSSEEIKKSISKFTWINGRISTYVLYVLSKMLPSYPKFTAYYKDEHIYFYNAVNLGIAIDLEKGLKVGVVKAANTLNLFDLYMTIIDCVACYYENNFTPSLFSHSTITTTDLSNEGILFFQPVLNANQSAIIGIGGDQKLTGSPMTITIVFDHRVLSGQEVAIFLKALKEKVLQEHMCLEVN